MDIQAKITELEQQLATAKHDAEKHLAFLQGKIEALKELVEWQKTEESA